MKRLTATLCLTIAVLLGSVGESFGQGVWFPTDKPNCLIWNPNPQEGETATWSGDCLNGKANGLGRETWKFKESGKWVERYVDGELFNGRNLGQVRVYYENEAEYVGTLNATDGKRHGQGTYTHANGDKYVGEWKDGKKHGQGTFTWANGDKYVGEWRDDKGHGQGTWTSADGDKYVGEFRDGKKHGHGTYTWAKTGNKYVGEFRDGLPNGQGTKSWANGNKYVGEFRYGKRNGQGTYTYANGDKYVGEYRAGKRHGQGTHTSADGKIMKGIWKDGQFQDDQKVTLKSAAATEKVWVVLMSVYVAPPDAGSWDGPWKHLMTMKMYDETQKFASKRECETAGTTLKKKFRKDGILSPHRIKCVSFDSTLPKGAKP